MIKLTFDRKPLQGHFTKSIHPVTSKVCPVRQPAYC